jgi:hypothetical protein
MKGVMGKFANLLIYVLTFVMVAGVVVMVAHGTPIAQSQCIITQSGEITNLMNKIKEADERGITIPHTFNTLDCLKCMWYDSNIDQLIVVYSTHRGFLGPEELMYDNYSISTNFVDIGCNCTDCGETDGQPSPKYCANLRGGEDLRYQLEINSTHIKCANCLVDSPTFKSCPTTFEKCICPSGLCRKLNCGEKIVNASLDYVDENKYFQYTLSAPTTVNITLIQDVQPGFPLGQAVPYLLYVKWEKDTCPIYELPCCIFQNNTVCSCTHNLPAGTYYFEVVRRNILTSSYNLTVSCV